jgi:hypothetical protein
MTGKRVIFVGTVHEAVQALGVLLDSEAERAAYWGSHVGRPAAEPFAVLREVT